MTDRPSTYISPDSIIGKWIAIIAYWTLITAVLNLFFFGLVQFSLMKGSFSPTDQIDILSNSLIGFLTFLGLRRYAAWGWKLAVVAIPCSWLYGVYSISQHYQPGMGIATSAFLFIDAAIIIFLFTPAVQQLFRINAFWPALVWIRYPLLVTAVFLLAFDFLGNRGGVITAFIVFSAIMAYQHFKKKYPNNPDKLE
ncbi:MAG: hypothetical protein JW902_18370 [Syntrophaceae bacterium]|nr:hypothetical protein [Syntrophaceae bacterium]